MSLSETGFFSSEDKTMGKDREASYVISDRLVVCF